MIGVSESRVSQIHGQLKRKIKSQLEADASLFSDVA